MLAHMHSGQYLSRPSWETQPSWRATLPSPPREQAAAGERGEAEEEREPLGRQEVYGASGRRRCFGPRAEGGGGEGSDFLAWGWLLGVGLSDYRGAGTQQAGMGIMRCLSKCRNPLEHRESYTIPAWNGAHGLSLAGESSLDISLWPCGCVAVPTGPGGSEEPHQASRLSSTDLEPQTFREGEPQGRSPFVRHLTAGEV